MAETTQQSVGAQQNAAAHKAATVKTFLVALATDRGPKLLAFRLSNLLIGRLPDNHLSLNHGSVSRRHARIAITQTGVTIEDLGSQNGTTLNGSPVKQSSQLRPGDIVRVGHVPIYYFGFINPSQPPKTETIESTILLTPVVPSVG